LSKADSRITKDPNYPIVTELRRDLENLASLSFDEDGNLLVTIDGITKTFVPKD
jgi:hypothetical protein